MQSYGVSLPKPGKTRGEDAYFTALNAVGVADGVGGWSAKGIDSGKFSRAMMKHARAHAAREVLPTKLMMRAYAESQQHPGSATVCLLTLDARGTLRTSVLGDCGYVVLRGQDLVYLSASQTHDFNTPFQLGQGGDPPQSAAFAEHRVQSGDHIITGSDGLFDNLHTPDLQALVQRHAVLRTYYSVDKEGFTQIVLPEHGFVVPLETRAPSAHARAVVFMA